MARYDSRDDTETRIAWLEREARAVRDLVEARRALRHADDDGQVVQPELSERGRVRLIVGGKPVDKEGKGA